MAVLDEESNSGIDLLGGPYAYRRRDVVVATQHAGLVLGQLREAGAAVQEQRTSELLGLTLLQLDDVGQAASALRERVGGDADARPSAEQPLEEVLVALRVLSARRYAGWSPTIGKNRYVGPVHGVGRVNHAGGGDPEPAAGAWPARATGPGQGTRVGVLDCGLYPQPWLAGGWAARFSDLLDASSSDLYADGHATFVSGLILRQAPGSTVEVRRVLQSTGQVDTNGSADSWSVAEAIVDFGRSGLDILNLSFVCYTEDGQAPLVLSTAIDRLPPSLLVVAAAGNHGAVADPGPHRPDVVGQGAKAGWPAALDDVVAVGALQPDQATSADFSPDAPWVDVLAPGVDLTSTYLPRARPDGRSEPVDFPAGWARWSGTSFAAAVVSGVVAASTQPGRVPARAAAADLLASLPETSQPTLAWSGARLLKLPQI